MGSLLKMAELMYNEDLLCSCTRIGVMKAVKARSSRKFFKGQNPMRGSDEVPL